MGCSAAAFVLVAFIAAIALAPAASQAADVQAQIDSFSFAPQRLTSDATSGKALRQSARRGRKGWITLHRPDGEVVYIKVDQIVFVMSAKNTGAAERARSKLQLLAGHSDVRESVEEVMQTIENDGSLVTDVSDMSSPSGIPLSRPDVGQPRALSGAAPVP
jgi:hypothetical protein